MGSLIIIRCDANATTGFGHVMRCSAIAESLADDGVDILFAVSDEESKHQVMVLGYNALVVGGDSRRFVETDGKSLATIVKERSCSFVLIDSYAITEEFFWALRCGLDVKTKLALIDDQYSYSLGMQIVPRRLPVDIVINYTYYSNALAYTNVYNNNIIRLIGPKFAPLRKEFRDSYTHRYQEEVSDVLVTTGSTNPAGILERLVSIVQQAVGENARVHVIVGDKSHFRSQEDRIIVYRNVRSMSQIMSNCQIAISAAGTTLYELNAMGVATLAICIVDNQQENLKAFVSGGYGLGLYSSSKDFEIAESIIHLMNSETLRRDIVNRGFRIDGRGSSRISSNILKAMN